MSTSPFMTPSHRRRRREIASRRRRRRRGLFATIAVLVLAAGLGDAGDFTNNGTVTNNGSITGVNQGGQMTWTQSGGSESGNAVALEGGALPGPAEPAGRSRRLTTKPD